jgi:hypothetical protein
MDEILWVERLVWVYEVDSIGDVGGGQYGLWVELRGGCADWWEVGTFQWLMQLPDSSAKDRVILMRYYESPIDCDVL